MKTLTQAVENIIDSKVLPIDFTLNIDGNDRSAYLVNWSVSYDKNFGAASATFVLSNEDGVFGEGGDYKIEVGNSIEFIENLGDMSFKKFYGQVRNRSISKAGNKQITLVCLDYLSTLEDMDCDIFLEGTKVSIENELLDPIYLDSPNESMAQLFNFANDSIATHPTPIIKFEDTNDIVSDPDVQFDGYNILYDAGQLYLGSPLNVLNNYNVKSTYSYYTSGIEVEDAITAILKQPTYYGKYMFDEDTEQEFIDNHLTATFSDVTDDSIDTMLPNYVAQTIKIKTALVSDWTPGDSLLYLTSTEGFPIPEVGQVIECEINGDIFTYSTIDTLNDTLGGIPSSGAYSLSAKKAGSIVEYENTYSAGQVWYLDFNNLKDTRTASDFTVPSGSTIDYVDHKGGRIILDSAISLTATVTCDVDYNFYTLQSTGITINQIRFRSRDISDRFAAIQELRKYLAPNYLLRTIGDNKIWGSYVRQKTSADYELKLIQNLNYLEDSDLYTRTLFYRKNKNPTNIMFGDDIDYTSDEEDTYTGIAVKRELSYMGQEKSGSISNEARSIRDSGNPFSLRIVDYIDQVSIQKDYPSQNTSGYYIYSTPISGDIGKIILDRVVPVVYINGVPINNKAHRMTAMPVKVQTTTKTQTVANISGGKSKSTEVRSYYYYKVIFPHSSIVPNKPIYLYNNQGVLEYTLQPNDPNMNYSTGIWTIPGTERNDIAEILSTATYQVLFSSNYLQIDYENVLFKVNRKLIPNPDETVVRATFEYWAIALNEPDIGLIVDGRRDTQFQMEFFGEPPLGFHLATIDLGSIQPIQAIDIVAGFFRPDEYRKFDVNFRMQMQYSEDGVNFHSLSDATESIELSGGGAISLEEEALGSGLQARYLRFNVLEVGRIDYGKGRYVVAITELSVYGDIVIESNASLIPTTQTTGELESGDTIINVVSTSYFAEPESGEEATAYVDGEAFTYSGLTSTSFTGVDLPSGASIGTGSRVSQTLEDDTSLYDDDGLLPNLGDRVYKSIDIDNSKLFLQSDLDTLSKAWLREFYKDHSKLTASIVYSPFLGVGDTIALTDSYNNKVSERYFVENISENRGSTQLTLARYPE